jgi:cyclopropane fatty-acyl-phospholipid synthase-like methyltransferase
VVWSAAAANTFAVSARTILELAPGAGRWSEFLKDLCSRLILVDVSANAIQRCRTRFAGYNHIECHVNDGKSLSMVPGNSLDLIFSFNSMVHVDEDDMRTYIAQISSKITKDGAGFIHQFQS